MVSRTSTMEDPDKRPQFGNRLLTDPKNVFEHNAWDNVEWDDAQQQEAEEKVEKNTRTKVKEGDVEKYESEANIFWDEFYNIHQNRFFKDRHWLFTEFPELAPYPEDLEGIPQRVQATSIQDSNAVDLEQNPKSDALQVETNEALCSETSASAGEDSSKSGFKKTTLENDPQESADSGGTFPGSEAKTRFLEVGCGVGNTVFPVLQTNNDPDLFMYCCDLSPTAIQIVKEHPDYTEKRCHAFVCNVTDLSQKLPFPEQSLDIVVLIFVLSAISPDRMQDTINRLSRHLKPGGLMLFRDYGRYDLAQIRFKDGQCLSDNFYVRGDGTRVYFFTQDELKSMFEQAGLVEEQNYIDRRLQVNRGRQLKMYRVWIQCKYRRPRT